MGSFLDFIIGIRFVVNMGWVTIVNLGFVFDRPGLDTVISISSIEGVGIGVSSASTLIL